MLSFRRIGAVYVLVLMIAVFGIWIPTTFLSTITALTIFNEQAITALVALSLVVPLAAGVFDLSVGYNMGLAAVVVAWLLANTTVSPPVAIILTLLVSLCVGAINGAIVVLLRIDSFIGTLASGSLLLGAILALTGNVQIVNRVDSLTPYSESSLFGYTVPVFYALALGIALWYVMEHTRTGRYVYATGFGPDAARLAGIRVGRLRFLSLLTSAVISGSAGILITARIGVGSPTVGPSYLLPAFAAVFLGATQLKPGRFTAWGTLLAVLLLGTVTVGMSLAEVPPWLPYLFNGLALIAAVAAAGRRRH